MMEPKLIIIHIHIYVCIWALCMYACLFTTPVSYALGSKKKFVGSLELEL